MYYYYYYYHDHYYYYYYRNTEIDSDFDLAVLTFDLFDLKTAQLVVSETRTLFTNSVE